MLYVVIFFVGVIGLCIGSFINVVVRRLYEGEGGMLTGTSHCPQCDHDLAWYDNIPLVSYLLLHGRCRYCTVQISPQYPIVESLTASIFVFLTYGFFHAGQMETMGEIVIFVCILLCVGAMIAVGVYDFISMEVPMVVLWWGFAFAVVAVVMRSIHAGDVDILMMHGLSGVVAFSFFFALSYFSGERWMGAGDAYIALVMGVLLGGVSAFVAILLAVWSGTIIGIGLLVTHRAKRGTQIPFGPFLVWGMIGSLSIILLWPEIIKNLFVGVV